MFAPATLNASLKTAGHYYDFDTNTLYVTKAYLKKAETYGTPECNNLNEMMAQFPGMKIEIHKKTRTNNAISYEMMEGFIRIMPQAEWRMKEYQRIKQWDVVGMYEKEKNEANARAVGKDGTVGTCPASAVRTQEMNAENLLAEAG